MGGRLSGLQWLSLLEPGVAADIPDVQQFRFLGHLLEHLHTVESLTSKIPRFATGRSCP